MGEEYGDATKAVRESAVTRGKDHRAVIALEDFSYVVVLADRGKYVLLWTAYCVEKSHRRRKLEKEFKAYTKSRNG